MDFDYRLLLARDAAAAALTKFVPALRQQPAAIWLKDCSQQVWRMSPLSVMLSYRCTAAAPQQRSGP